VFSPLNCSEPKTVSKTRLEIAGVSDATNYLVTNQINVWP